MSILTETAQLGLRNLRRKMLRSILTALGIIFGVAAVIIMVAIGEGSTRQALAQIEQLGARNIIIRSQRPPESANQNQGSQSQSRMSKYGITRLDLEVIKQNFPDAESIVPLKEVGGQVLRNERRRTSQAYGVVSEFAQVANLRVSRGRYLTKRDMDDAALVCVIGAELVNQFFPMEDPLGQTLRIDAKVFHVVGVLAPIGLAGGAGSSLVGRDLNFDMHIPMTTAQQVFGDSVFRRTGGSFSFSEVQVSEIYMSVPSRDRVAVDAERLRRVLNVRHPGMTDATMIVPLELLATAQKTRRTANIVLTLVAAVSLLVGGIGIMNIMLASVTERTREIGIRRAIGATRDHILLQFLVETGVLSVIGGLIGVIAGISVALVLDKGIKGLTKLPYISGFLPADSGMPTSVTLWSVLLAFVVAVLTGLVFGIYPARRASMQDPIVALRHD
jgi:putative ABC transport system permease protein